MSTNPFNIPPCNVPAEPDHDYDNDQPVPVPVQQYPPYYMPPNNVFYYNGQLVPFQHFPPVHVQHSSFYPVPALPYYVPRVPNPNINAQRPNVNVVQPVPSLPYYVPCVPNPNINAQRPNVNVVQPVPGLPYNVPRVPNPNINAQHLNVNVVQHPNLNVQSPNLNVQHHSPYHVSSYPLEQAPMLQELWEEDYYLAFGYQKLFRDLIDCIAQLEEHSITNGYLNNDTISIIDGHAKITKIPDKSLQNLPSFREELRRLTFDKLGDYMAKKSQHLQLELWSFYESLEYNLPRLFFRQLMYHPLLQSASERCYFRLRSSMHIHYRPDKNTWIAKFRNMRRNVNIAGIFGHKDHINQLPEDKRPFATLYHNGKYEQNAYGVLIFGRNAVLHINDRQRYGNELSTETVDHCLNDLFPEAITELFNYMVDMQVDMNSWCEEMRIQD